MMKSSINIEEKSEYKGREVLVLFESLDLEPTQENLDQFRIMLECMFLYQKRSKSYGPVWKRYGALSNLLRAAAKIDRLIKMWWIDMPQKGIPALHKDNLDDAFDLINYAAFFIRSARIGNITGSYEEAKQNSD